MTETHPFAQYVRILGRGRTLSRSLTFEEAEVAMGMILRDEILTEQLGATCLLQGISIPDTWQPIRTPKIFWGKPFMGVFRSKDREIEDDYAIAAITSTLGVALRRVWARLTRSIPR